jgi:AraC family transcriptional regulator
MTEFRASTVPRTSGLALEQHIRGRKLLQSEGNAWQDVEAQIFRRAAEEDGVLVPAVAEPLLVWIMSGSAFVEERELDADWQGRNVSAGDFFLTQTTAPYMMRWRTEDGQSFEVLHLYLGLALISRVTAEVMGGEQTVRLRDISGAKDDMVSNLLTALRSELKATVPASATFVQGIAQSLAVHLVRSYADIAPEASRHVVRLPAFKLRRAIEFMEENLAAAFDLEKVARAAGMSRFHFSRGFRTSMAQAPSQWFIRQRIARAQQLLRETDQSIIEIGMGVGYASPSHFAQIFRRETGVSPSDYRSG